MTVKEILLFESKESVNPINRYNLCSELQSIIDKIVYFIQLLNTHNSEKFCLKFSLEITEAF